jgi:pyridoxamine 5'-phosphate oxidase
VSNSLADLRREYTLGGLRRADLLADPIAQFKKWFDEAMRAEVLEPNAMTLATANAQGEPSSRTVLIKAVDERGFVFFTNYDSRKGRDLASNPKASITFYWRELERQVNVFGTITKVPREESEAYFHSRPLGSQFAAWASTQGTVVADRRYLETKLAEVKEKHSTGPVPLPSYWGGYVVAPNAVEFWQGRPNRLHDRFRYLKNADSWQIDRLSP